MKLNKTLAVALHRAMWTDMRTELGDNPSPNQRACFKATWIKEHFPNENVRINCFLCEYAHRCSACPIRWPGGFCTGPNFSHCSAPISDILALPEKGKYVSDETATVRTYYGYREELLSKASGLPGSSPIDDHVKAIQEKAVQQSTFWKLYGDTKLELAKASGHPAADGTAAHIKAIKEKAVEEYFEKTPGAKLASMDVDQAFKQYADEQKAPIFHALAEASGLSADESVNAHISKIEERAKQNGLSLSETYRKSMTLFQDTLNKYKDELSEGSGLKRDRPVADHIMRIYDDGFSDGQNDERARIMKKIGEMLNDKSARETKDS